MNKPLRCILFVPGNRPERYAKALASGVDAVAIDLEDAVALDAKDSARDAALDALRASRDGNALLGLRINPPDSEAGIADLRAISAGFVVPDFLMIPKFERATQVEAARKALFPNQCPIILLIESARGLLDVDREMAHCGDIAALMFGGYDLSVELGARFAWQPLLQARSQLRLVSAAHQVDCIDVPWVDIADAEGLRAETQRVIELGYSGKAAIHPAQVDPIQQAFAPDPESVARAREIIAAADAAGGDAVQLDGRLVDLPVVLAARRVLALAGSSL